MRTRELYQSAFSKLHASEELKLEEIKVKKRTGFRCRRIVFAVAAVLALIMAMSVIAFAATGGNLFYDVKVLVGGKTADSEMVSEDGKYLIKVQENGDGTEYAIYDRENEIEQGR